VAARAIFDQSVAAFKEFGDRWGTAYALDNAGLAESRSGDLGTARGLHEGALAISRELGDERGAARAILHLADVASAEGDTARARALHLECLRLRQALGDMPGVAVSMERLAWVEMADAPENAARLLGSAERLRERIHTPLPPAARAEYERSVRVLAGRLGDASFGAARLEGHAMDPRVVVAAVLADRFAAADAGAPREASPLP